MRRFIQSVGARLSLALLLVVAIALGIVYLTVVPSMRNRLVDARVSDLERSAARLQQEARTTSPLDSDTIAAWADVTGARVLLVQSLSGTPIVIDDSRGGASSKDVQDDHAVMRAASTGHAQHGTVEEAGQHYAEAAVPIRRGQYILVLRDSVENRYDTVDLVQRRLLLAAGVALAIALLLGYAGARMFARRIKRLERAADRIASGRFDEPVVDTHGDELAALAAAFERMRVRLAHLDDARRAFVANASHELRTPLFSLGGFLELLDDEELDEATRREFLASMREQVDRLTKLAADLLDLTRLDAGRMTVEREPVDLGALARDLVEEFGPLAAATGHTLTGSLDGELFADADELRTLQLGRILVENALLHTPAETAVDVRARRRGDAAVLEVEDGGGPGIPADQQQQLFERFFRLGGGRASGSGLGLAIAKELAELMDGSVEVESEPGRTIFSLVLPSAAYPPAAISREITRSGTA